MDFWTERLVFGLFLVITSLQIGHGKRIGQSIYTDLDESAFCFRRTNGTHQMGCSSDQNGNVGVVHMIASDADQKWLVETGPHAPYIAMITPKMFKRNILIELRNSGKITGIILLGVNDTILEPDLTAPEQFSGDAKCPNSHSSLYKDSTTEESCGAEKNPWNPMGSGILLDDWSFPIFFIDNPEKVQDLVFKCYEERNKPFSKEPRDWPLCAVELKSHMTASVDTKTCQRRNDLVNPFSPTLICDPMGDQNIFHLNVGTEVDLTKDRFEDKSVLIVSARLDAIGLFDKLEVGFDSPSLGIVTLLAAAQILNQKEQFTVKTGKNVMFTLFNGESFDYIGSSKMMYDIQNNKFPEEITSNDEPKEQWPIIDIKSISAHLELGQLFNNGSNDIFAHIDSEFDDQNLLSTIKSEASNLGLNVRDASSKILPPASIQSTLKASDRKIPAILLSNFDESYKNNFYHSLYDNAETHNYDHEEKDSNLVEHLAKISETVARVVNKIVGDSDKTIEFQANKTLINDLIQCYTVNANCELFSSVANAGFGRWPETLPQYVGVDRKTTYHTMFTYRLLAYLTSAKQPLDGVYSSSNCTAPTNQSIYDYIFISGEEPPSWFPGTKEECRNSLECGYCYKTTAQRIKAVSPAFEIENYDFHNDTYSSWSESSWQTTSSRMFLKADPGREKGYLALGIFLLIGSFISVIWLDKFAMEIFVHEASAEQSQAVHL